MNDLAKFEKRLGSANKGWGKRLYEAQQTTHYGDSPRVKAGDQGDRTEPDGCFDCGCAHGEYHAPGCEMERCPICGGQFIDCNCIDYPGVKKVRDYGHN